MALEDLPDAARDGTIACEIRWYEDRVRTQAFRSHCRHGRMHTEAPGLVRSSADDRAIALPSNDHGLAAQPRIIALLDRSVKRVHVAMDDFSRNLLATILFRVPEQGERVSGGSLTVVAINSRDACSCPGLELLFRTRDFCSLPACAVHLVGCFRCLADTLAPDSSLAACRFSYLGNPYGTASLAVPFDCAGELARRERRSRACPGRVPAPLLGQAGLSGYFFNHANDCGGNHLRSESCVLWPAGLDRREGRTIGLELDRRSQ